MLRWLTAGESHGPALIAILEGLPADVATSTASIDAALARRRAGYGRGPRMALERDEVSILGGLRHGRTLGSPFAVSIANTEWPSWSLAMSPDPVPAEELAGLARNAPLTRPRPGHADVVGMQKYGFDDARPVLERASARETAARVALGAVAADFLRQAYDINILSHVVGLGGVETPAGLPPPAPGDQAAVDASPVRCFDADAGARMVQAVDDAKAAGETLGGVVEVLAYGVPPGLGSYVHADRRLDALLAGALMGIPAIKGVEIGDGFALARLPGSAAMDEIVRDGEVLARMTGRLGGTEGGMSNGAVLRVRAAMKPLSTLPRPLRTVDVATGEPALAHQQRSDVCAVPAAGVVAEAVVALVLAAAALEKFGGDTVAETRRSWSAYVDSLRLSPAQELL